MPDSPIRVRERGMVAYLQAWEEMRSFTAARTAETADEIWLLEHPPIYTYGLACRSEHLPRPDTGIPVVKSDRGGQVTYHGPGQLIAYVLFDLKRARFSVRALVRALEQAVIDLLDDFGVASEHREDAPGVYVNGAKLAALGLRIKRGCSYHGLSLNVDMDLAPFAAIDPCGYPGLAVTQLRDLGIAASMQNISERLLLNLNRRLAYRVIDEQS